MSELIAKDASQISHLKMSEIFADPTFNCRGSIAPIDVAELARDIDEHGLQQPIVVKPIKSGEALRPEHKYKVVSGHRRHRAFQVLNRETIPCIVNPDLTDAQALILNLGENLHRKDLNIMQEATAIDRLKMEGFTIADVSAALNKSSTWVQVRFILLELPEVIQEAAAAGFINHKHIRDLHRMKDVKSQLEAAKKIKEAKLRGERPPNMKKGAKRDIIKMKARDRDDIFWMQDHIQDAVGNNFGTRCLAWCAGEISDFDLFQDLEQIAIKAGLKYTIPYDLGALK